MDDAEKKRNAKVATQEAGKRDRAPMKGVKASDNPTQPADFGRE